MIKLKDISVIFSKDDIKREVKACVDINVDIEKKDIFGIVGYSGAGKSTLVRCINLLQRPTKGNVFINGVDITKVNEKRLRQERKNIGMIFQHFNLMNMRTVFENVYYPLRNMRMSKQEKIDRVDKLLELTGMTDRKNQYPNNLSGGQKQRVAIARALATDPEILLCDEATSALDPKTTLTILKLLKELNEKLGITIILITHEMAVVKEICNKCAVMEDGRVIEQGSVLDIFTKPKEKLTKEFINVASHKDEVLDNINDYYNLEGKLYSIKYVGNATNNPYMIEIYRKFGVETNILYGNIEYIEGIPIGNLIVTLSGDRLEEAFEYLRENDIEVEVL